MNRFLNWLRMQMSIDLFIMDKALDWLSENKSDALSIAQIHATVLSIVMAVFFLLYTQVSVNIDKMKFQLIQDAYKFENFPLRGLILGENDEEQRNVSEWKASPDNISSTLRQLLSLVPDKVQNDDPKYLIAKGRIALLDISKLSTHYPFLPTVSAFTGTSVVSREQHLYFESADKVVQWVIDLDSIVEAVQMAFEINSQLRTMINAYIKTVKHQDMVTFFLEEFLKDIQSYKENLKPLKIQVAQYRKYTESHLNKSVAVFYIYFALFSFFSSIVVPMFRPSCPRFFILVVPIMFYLTSFYLIYVQIMHF